MVETSIDEPLYTMADTQATLRLFKTIEYEREIDVAPGVHATFLDAGHILGSAIIRVRISDGDNSPEKIIVFSGDVGRHDTPIIRDPTTVSDADYLLVESTYGGREHEPQVLVGPQRTRRQRHRGDDDVLQAVRIVQAADEELEEFGGLPPAQRLEQHVLAAGEEAVERGP